MELIRLDDHLRIYNDEAIMDIISRGIINPSAGKLKSIAESIYSKQQGRFYIAVRDEEILAVIGIRIPTGREAELMHISVKEGFERQGIARFMLKEAIRLDGIERLVVEGCSLNKKFFKSCGLRVAVEYDDILMSDRFICTT